MLGWLQLWHNSRPHQRKNKPRILFSFSRCAPHLLVRCGVVCCSFVLKFIHRFAGEPSAVSVLGIKRSHRGSLPAEYRIELRDGRAIISRPCRADFAATVRRTIEHTGGPACFLECGTKRLLRERLALGAAYEREFANRTSIKCTLQDGLDRERNVDLTPALFGA